MKTPQEIAESIMGRGCLDPGVCRVYNYGHHRCYYCHHVELIAAAIQAERDVRPPKGHIRTDDGVTRRVLGELPLTADGCVVGDGWGGPMFYLRGIQNEVVGPFHSQADTFFSGPPQWHKPHNCYSTREAAEAAKKETT